MKPKKIQKLIAENKCIECKGKGTYFKSGYTSRDGGCGTTVKERYSEGGPCPVCGGTGRFDRTPSPNQEYWRNLISAKTKEKGNQQLIELLEGLLDQLR